MTEGSHTDMYIHSGPALPLRLTSKWLGLCTHACTVIENCCLPPGQLSGQKHKHSQVAVFARWQHRDEKSQWELILGGQGVRTLGATDTKPVVSV